MPILKAQNVLANTDSANPLGFGVLDGRRVPPRYLEVFDLDESITEVVLASDGYLSAASTLKEAEADLAASLTSDPLRIGEHASTKAVGPGASSYDDRTYIRVRGLPVSVKARGVDFVVAPGQTGLTDPVGSDSSTRHS